VVSLEACTCKGEIKPQVDHVVIFRTASASSCWPRAGAGEPQAAAFLSHPFCHVVGFANQTILDQTVHQAGRLPAGKDHVLLKHL
jgi:hypothetical protein